MGKNLKNLFSSVNSIKSSLKEIKEASLNPVVKKKIKYTTTFIYDFLTKTIIGLIILLLLSYFNFFSILGIYIPKVISFFLTYVMNNETSFLFGKIIYFYVLFLIFLYLFIPLDKETYSKIFLNTFKILILAIGITIIYSLFTGASFINLNFQDKFDLGFQKTTTQIKKIFDDIACSMDMNCIREKQKQKKAKIKSSDYSLNINFYNEYKDYYLNNENKIELPFVISIMTGSDESNRISLIKYECYIEETNESTGEKILKKINEKEFENEKEILTYGKTLKIEGSCEVPIKNNLEIFKERVYVKVHTEAYTECEYPFYLLNIDYFTQKYNIILNKDMNSFNKKAFIKSSYFDKIKEEFNNEDIDNAKFYCSNDLFSVSSSSSNEMPLFFDNSGTLKNHYRLAIKINKNEYNSLGKTEEGKLLKLKKPSKTEIDYEKSLNIGPEERLLRTKFNNNELNFVLFFNNFNEVKDSEIRYLTMKLLGNFVYEKGFEINFHNENKQ